MRCTKTKRTCPGYRKSFDLVLRDQNQITRDKVQGKKHRRNASPLSLSSSSTSPEPFHNSRDVPVTKAAWQSPSPPTELVLLTPEDIALCMFFSNFVVITRHPDTNRGYMDALMPLYNTARPDSLLYLAVITVSLAIFGGSRRHQRVTVLAQNSFGKALVATQKAIQDPIESVKDETLMAVLLLSLFEVSTTPKFLQQSFAQIIIAGLSERPHFLNTSQMAWRAATSKYEHRRRKCNSLSVCKGVISCFHYEYPSISSMVTDGNEQRIMATSQSSTMSGVHDAGATALVKHRGREINTRSHVSTMLLYAVYTQVVSYRFWRL